MSQGAYRSMSHMPSHGNASNTQAGNARENYQMREGYAQNKYGMNNNFVPGAAAGYYQQQCHFPQAPPKRCYCTPAPFTSLDGRSHFRLIDSYGSSRPCQNYM